MLRYSIDGHKFEIPSTLNELSFNDYVTILDSKEAKEQIQILTKLDSGIIDKYFNELQVFCTVIIEYIYAIKEEATVKLNIDNVTIGALIDAQNVMIANKSETYKIYPKLIAILTSTEYDYEQAMINAIAVSNQDTLTVLELGNSCIVEYNKFYKMFIEPLSGSEYSDKEKAAGIEELQQKWGFYSTMYELCNADINNFDKFTKLEARSVYVLLQFLKDKREYEKNLAELTKNK